MPLFYAFKLDNMFYTIVFQCYKLIILQLIYFVKVRLLKNDQILNKLGELFARILDLTL